MPRPRKPRRLGHTPSVLDFKPRGVPMRALQEIYLGHDGLEALRLCDHDGLDQAAAAARLGVSRQTLGRILAQARRTVARALIEGLALRIETAVSSTLSLDPEETMNAGKIAVTSQGPHLDDTVDPRFGRAQAFVVVDPQTMEAQPVVNPGIDMPGGAGPKAAEAIVNAGAGVLLTGQVGPKARQALDAAGVVVVEGLDGLTVRAAVETYLQRTGAET